MIILDTSAIIDIFRGREGILDLIDTDVTTTVINYHEIMAGVKHKKAKIEERYFRRFFSKIEVLPYESSAAEKSSEIQAYMMNLGKKANTLDILIAAIAIQNGAEKILTRDRDFVEISKITDLKVIVY